ncbi:hypothetical protein N657DRAFT_642096 [Parathielavia appendiculata]|uniref:Uncharacterized protein n=1 Tax=Parathielavia appendiculata TaxID=2587402 RepID=A0AAN6Z7M4_9PEZI|nr:hypothetical protein N657DRAFT_642096 [Parathielavia appendiculata]
MTQDLSTSATPFLSTSTTGWSRASGVQATVISMVLWTVLSRALSNLDETRRKMDGVARNCGRCRTTIGGILRI